MTILQEVNHEKEDGAFKVFLSLDGMVILIS